MASELLSCALTRLHIDFIQVEGVDRYRGEITTMHFSLEMSRHVKEERQFKVTLKAAFSEHSKDNVQHGFQVEASILGFVRISTDVAEDVVSRHAALNSVNTLYGTLRGLILGATGAFPAGPMILKSLTAQEIIDTLKDRTRTEGRSVKRTAHRLRSLSQTKHQQPSEEGIKSAQKVFAKVLEQADPVRPKPAKVRK